MDKEVAQFFKERKYFPCQKLRKENRDGSLLIESRVSRYMEILPTIFFWIPFITVINPEELKKEIKEAVTKYLVRI